MFYKLLLTKIILFYTLNQCICISPSLTVEEVSAYKSKVLSMFSHAYDSYLTYASNYDELQPISCRGMDTWGRFSLSLIDALDTLAVIGNYTEFRRVAKKVLDTIDFNTNINVSVFETNIRVIGGLLSAHLMSRRAGMETEDGWPCSGPLLRLAEDAARRLLPAFDTNTGMPYGTVNLRYGVPENETPITCTAGVGTFILEFCTLSRLTGDPIFQTKALNAITALHKTRSSIGLLGNHINVEDGKWTATEAGIGAGVDSYFEYLVKGAMLLQMPQLMDIFNEYYDAINKYIKKDDWYVWVSMTSGSPTMPIFQSLEAFWPGLLTLVGEIDQAKKSLYNYHQIWKQYGFVPEFYDIPNSKFSGKRDGYPLRPEFVESVLYLYRTTRDPHLLQIGADIVDSIYSSARTECGFATVKSVDDHTIEDRMESFFLAETLKYLYLLFDENNFLHNDGSIGSVIELNNSECVIESGGYVFNTEAHPIDIAAVYCCSAIKYGEDSTISYFQKNLDIYSILGLNTYPHFSFDLFSHKPNGTSNYLETSLDFNEENVNESELNKLNLVIDDSKQLYDDENYANKIIPVIINDNKAQISIEKLNDQTNDDSKLLPSKVKYSTDDDMIEKVSHVRVESDLKSTLESSLSETNIPLVEKTVGIDVVEATTTTTTTTTTLCSVPNNELNEQITASIDKEIDIDLLETSATENINSESIGATHSIEGWHSKSEFDDISEEVLSIISANPFVRDRLSKQIIKVFFDNPNNTNSNNDQFSNSSHKQSTDDYEYVALNSNFLNYESLLCPSQPFLMRLSFSGQMIVLNHK